MRVFRLALVLLMILMVSLPAFASVSRVAGFGESARFLDKDDSFVFQNPAFINIYREAVYGEFGQFNSGTDNSDPSASGLTANMLWGGVFKKVGPVNFGLFIGRPYAYMNSYYGVVGQAVGGYAPLNAIPNGAPLGDLGTAAILDHDPFGNSITPDNAKVNLIAGLDLDFMKLGFMITYAGNSDVNSTSFTDSVTPANNNSTDVKRSISELGFLAGVLMKVGSMDIQASLGLTLPSVSASYSETGGAATAVDPTHSYNYDYGTDGAMLLDFNGRIIIKNDVHNLIIGVSFASHNMDSSYLRQVDADGDGALDAGEDDKDSYLYSRNNIVISFGDLVKVTKKANWALGLSANINSITRESKGSIGDPVTPANQDGSKVETSEFTVVFSTGFEYIFSKAFEARLGISKMLYGTQDVKTTELAYTGLVLDSSTTGTVTTDLATDTVAISAGMTLKIGDIRLDWVISQELLMTGGWVVSGLPESFSTQLTASWKFGSTK